MNRLVKIFYRILYALPFGIKGADKAIMGGADELPSGTEINQEVSDERVAKHMLKGEVTQEVEELRYRTYRVSNESENYDYVGNGVAVKTDRRRDPELKRKKIRFTQENELLCASVLEEMGHINDYGVERYRIEATYDGPVRFKLEQFITTIDVSINTKEGEEQIDTVMHFTKTPNPYNAKSMPFINELAKVKDIKGEYGISRNEILSSLKTISFNTYKASNEDNFVTYGFFNPTYAGFEENEDEFRLRFSWESFARVPLNLEEKYYSKTMDEKYRNKERKNTPVNMSNVERKRYCSVCGKEMSTYDGDIQEYDGGVAICTECLAKAKGIKMRNKA